MQNFEKYLESLDEGKIIIKRRYTENHPEKNVRKGANIRNTIIEALRDKKLTLSEFNEIVAQHSKSPSKWSQRNKRFFTIKEDNVTLSRYGNKIAKTIQPVNEGRKEITKKQWDKADDDQREEWLLGAFSDPDDATEHVEKEWEDLPPQATSNMFESVNEAREKPFRKVKAGDVGQDYNGEDVTIVAVGKLGKLMKYDDTGMAEDGLSQGYLDKNDDAVAVESPEGGYALFTYGDDGVVVNESLNEAKAPKNWDSQFTMKAIEAYKNGEFDLEDDKSIAEWDKEYNGGRAPKPAFNTKDVVSYAVKTGKKPNGDKMDESVVNESIEDKPYFDFLNALRDSGATNMFGAAPYLQKEFGLSRSEARKVLGKWMKSFESAVNESSDLLDKVADIDDALMNTRNRKAARDWEEYTEDLFGEHEADSWEDIPEDEYGTAFDVGQDIMNKYNVKESVVNEGVHAKIKKAMKAVEKGETVYGENVRFPGRFKIVSFNKRGSMATVDYEDGTEPFEMAAMNIAIDKMKFESVVNERAKATQMLKDVAKGFASEVEGIKLSKEMAQAYLDWLSQSAYGKKYDGLPFDHIFKASFNWGIDRYTKDLKGEYKELKQQAKAMKESTIYTAFSNFVNESYMGEEVNEALKSSKLRNLLSMKKSPKDLMKAIYGATKIALDKVEDHQVVDVDPKQGPKQDGYVFYYTTQEKENPHAPDDYYNAKFPANTLLALAKGKSVFYVKHTWHSRGKNTYSLTTDPKGGYTRSSSASDIGPNKSYSGYDASGLGSLSRVISIADAAFVVNPDALETSHDKIKQRSQAKEGAIAFKDHKEFKNANMERYKEILTKRSESLDVDKEIMKAIEEVADIMKDGIKNKKKNRYGEVIMGTGKDGRDFKINDLTNFTNNLMSDYERWSGHMADVERAKEALKKGDDFGSRRGDEQWEIKYYTKQALEYSKNIKDRLRKLKNKNLAW
jgi:hypothetical protein